MSPERIGEPGGVDWRAHVDDALERLAHRAPPPPINGYWAPHAPNGRILGFDLSRMNEDQLLLDGSKAALYALGDGPTDYDRNREPLVLVHGINADPINFQALVDRFKDDRRYQLFVLAYDDTGRRTGLNGEDFAEQLKLLRQIGPAGQPLKIVAHSMGGIVTRRALNVLAKDPDRPLEQGPVDVVAVDVPWDGYAGPSDRGLGGSLMELVRPFMADGLEDMRARSSLFRGDRHAERADRHEGLYDVALPPSVRIDAVFAREGDEAKDYTEGRVGRLTRELARYFESHKRIRGSRQMKNELAALRDSAQWPAFETAMRRLAENGTLTKSQVRAGLERHFPRFAGNHTSVLWAQGSDEEPSFLDWLADRWR